MISFVLYIVLGLFAATVGWEVTSWQFWCILGLFWAGRRIAFTNGIELGTTQGMHIYTMLSGEQRDEVNKILKDLK